MVIDGENIAAGIIERLKGKSVPARYLATVLVGGDSAAVSFVAQKEKTAKKLGVDFRVVSFSADVAKETLNTGIEKLAKDDICGGIILQLPLPRHLNRDEVIASIPEGKDVDALRGALVFPPAVGVVREIFDVVPVRLENAVVAVVGMGFLVGRPIARWLEGKVKKLITLDIGSDFSCLKDADVAILGVGKVGLITPAMLKHSALVIDFGYSRGADGKLHGDLDSSQESLVMSYKLRYTPVPHGTGPILVAKLFENFYKLN